MLVKGGYWSTQGLLELTATTLSAYVVYVCECGGFRARLELYVVFHVTMCFHGITLNTTPTPQHFPLPYPATAVISRVLASSSARVAIVDTRPAPVRSSFEGVAPATRTKEHHAVILLA